MVPSDTKNQSDQNKTFRDVLGGLWVLGRMFGHEFHALLIFQKFLQLQMILLPFLDLDLVGEVEGVDDGMAVGCGEGPLVGCGLGNGDGCSVHSTCESAWSKGCRL